MKRTKASALREGGLRPDRCRDVEPQRCEPKFKQPMERFAAAHRRRRGSHSMGVGFQIATLRTAKSVNLDLLLSSNLRPPPIGYHWFSFNPCGWRSGVIVCSVHNVTDFHFGLAL